MDEFPQIPHDDVMDVMEMTNKIEGYISKVLKDHDLHLALSALISASINCLLAQCITLDEVRLYRNLFVQILDASILQINVKEPEKPAS